MNDRINITLLDGTEKSYTVRENGMCRFYFCSGTHADADDLRKTLAAQGKRVECDMHGVYGWYVSEYNDKAA